MLKPIASAVNFPPKRPILPPESSHSLLYLHFFLWEPGDYVLAHLPEDIKIPNAPEWVRV